MAGAFLQTTETSQVRSCVMEKADLPDASRYDVLVVLSSGSDSKYVHRAVELLAF